MGVIRKMNSTGDTPTMWRPEVEGEVKTAREMYDQAIGHDYTVVRFDNPQSTGTIVADPERGYRERFDPNATEYLLMPQTAGG